jgi:LmbE family N-acetylglucosaminyl deacetylase
MHSLRHDLPPTHILVVAAHPDDIEFYAGGTLATWSTQGAHAHYVLVTDGGSGSRDPRCTPAELARHRRAEQRRAAAVLGVSSVTFLGYPHAACEPTLELRLAIARIILQVRPEAMLTFDPHRYYHATGINHPDHLVVGASTLGAIMPLANTLLAAPSLLAEGLEPHDVSRIYLFEPATPTHWMPLTDADVARKLEALRAHASQLATWDGVSAAVAYGAQAAQAHAPRRSPVRRPKPSPASSWAPLHSRPRFTDARLQALPPRAFTPGRKRLASAASAEWLVPDRYACYTTNRCAKALYRTP